MERIPKEVNRVGSSRVLKKVGMTMEGRIRVKDRWRDSFLYSILDY